MKFRPKLSSRIDPEKLGIKVENKELDAIKESAETNGGVIDLADVYEVPDATEVTSVTKTLDKYLEREGLEYTESQYQKEYRLKAAHQIMINGGTTAQIAQALNISLTEARNLKRELVSRQKSAVRNIDVEQEVAKAIMFYDHIAAKSLQLSAKGGEKQLRNQVEALKVALQAQTDKQKFLQLAGVYENGFRSNSGNIHVNGANDVRDMVTAVLSGHAVEVVEEVDETDDGVELF